MVDDSLVTLVKSLVRGRLAAHAVTSKTGL